jgi:hypothetical protein
MAKAAAPAPHHWKAHDFTVWIALIVLLALGLGVRAAAEGRDASFADAQGTLRLAYPARWLPIAGSGYLLAVEDPLSGALAPTGLTVSRDAAPKDQPLDQIGRADVLGRSRVFNLYRALSVDPATVAGRAAIAITYAYVADPQGGALASERVPVVVRGVEVLVATDAALYRIDFTAADAVFDGARPVFDKILRGVVL